MREIYIGNYILDDYWKIVQWCRDTFHGSTYGTKWWVDINTLYMTEDFYTLFVLRWT